MLCATAVLWNQAWMIATFAALAVILGAYPYVIEANALKKKFHSP